jgi:hypothetical protein
MLIPIRLLLQLSFNSRDQLISLAIHLVLGIKLG